MLLIVAIAWIYVVLMMSITEHSLVAGIMTFLLYCVLPLVIILYLMATPQRRRRQAVLTAKSTLAAESIPSSAVSVPPPVPAALPDAGQQD